LTLFIPFTLEDFLVIEGSTGNLIWSVGAVRSFGSILCFLDKENNLVRNMYMNNEQTKYLQ
jgi:hypothetical protein